MTGGRAFSRWMLVLLPAAQAEGLLLRVLRGSVGTPFRRLPYCQALFMARAAHILVRPAHDLYIAINSYLIKHRALETDDVPLFFQLCYSSR